MIKAADLTKIADAAQAEFEATDSAAAEAHYVDEVEHACDIIIAQLGLPAPSAASLEAAEDWYNAMDKGVVIERCAQWGVDLRAAPGTLIASWADVAMHLFAARRDAGLPVRPQ